MEQMTFEEFQDEMESIKDIYEQSSIAKHNTDSIKCTEAIEQLTDEAVQPHYREIIDGLNIEDIDLLESMEELLNEYVLQIYDIEAQEAQEEEKLTYRQWRELEKRRYESSEVGDPDSFEEAWIDLHYEDGTKEEPFRDLETLYRILTGGKAVKDVGAIP